MKYSLQAKLSALLVFRCDFFLFEHVSRTSSSLSVQRLADETLALFASCCYAKIQKKENSLQYSQVGY